MNQHVKPPLAVTDPQIRKLLQLAGLRFIITRSHWLISEATIVGKALKAGTMTSEEVTPNWRNGVRSISVTRSWRGTANERLENPATGHE
jgi:hypothetical protein